MTDATPGPWRAAALLTGSPGEHPQSYLIESLNGLHIADVPEGYSANRRERATHRANARLIAAVPVMLTALREALTYFEDREDINYEGTGPNAAMSLATEIRAAIAEATGEAP